MKTTSGVAWGARAAGLLLLLLLLLSGRAEAGMGARAAPAPHSPHVNDAFLVFVPGAAGNCPAPPNGGTTQVGCRFALELWLDAGTNSDVTAQQSYLTFTKDLLDHARVSDLASACTLTSTVTWDLTTFADVLQNEVCNGLGPDQNGGCIFRGVLHKAGDFAYASGGQPETGGFFRVAQVGWCAQTPGQAVLHWQFSPPAPITRDTRIVDLDGDWVHNPALFSDYIINIGGATSTPTNTPTITPTATPTKATFTNTPSITPTAASTNTPTITPTSTSTPDAYLQLLPGAPGNCPAPPNGGTTQAGCRFELELWLDTGSFGPPNGVTALQAYMTFTHQLIRNARVSSIASGCVPTSTITADIAVFDVVLQNEVCNGPGNCVFRGATIGPGSLAYAVGELTQCPGGCGGRFRVAQVGLCAQAEGQAVMHWQFDPPAPPTRDTQIVALNGDLVHNPALFADYAFGVAPAPTATPTPTDTATPTPAGLINGHLTWEGVSQPNTRNAGLTVSLTLCDAGVPARFIGATDQNGNFTVATGLPPGNYNWHIKGPKNLANSGTMVVASSELRVASEDQTQLATRYSLLGTQVEFGKMRAGDADADNLVNMLDFNILKSRFGHGCPPDPDWDPRADFNNDCLVNSTDFSLMRNNFGLGGAEPDCP